jgi:hypothetical protein
MSHLPIHPERAAYLARRSARVGGTVIALALALAAATTVASLLVGGALGAIALATGISGAGMALLTGLTLRNARTHLRDSYLNEPRLRTVRRVLVVLCLAAVLCYAGLVVAAIALGVTVATFQLLLLEAIPSVLATIAAIAGHQILRP